MAKAKRKGKIFIDWLRNQRGSTAILPYSARARSGAPVAAPVSWSELKDIETPAMFSVEDVDTLIARANARTLEGWGWRIKCCRICEPSRRPGVGDGKEEQMGREVGKERVLQAV